MIAESIVLYFGFRIIIAITMGTHWYTRELFSTLTSACLA
jgi:hypothetical protein